MDTRSTKEIIKHNIKYYRLQKSLTQEQLAEKINMDGKYISYLECGTYSPSYETLDDIADVLEIEPYLLLKDDFKDIVLPNKIDEITHKRNTRER